MSVQENAENVAVILLSGGLDSATVLAIALAQGRVCHTVSFQYGQRHEVELQAAAKLSQRCGARSHRMVNIDMRSIGGSALTAEIDVPKTRTDEEIGTGIPITYVPARNTIFVAYAGAVAEVLGASEIFVGVNQLDSSGYPDCRPEWLRAMQEVLRLGTRSGSEGNAIQLRAPLIEMSKAEIIRTGVGLGVDYGATHSCYDPSPEGLACGDCDACSLRRRGFELAAVTDPTRYR